jgi:hypothetical protein
LKGAIHGRENDGRQKKSDGVRNRPHRDEEGGCETPHTPAERPFEKLVDRCQLPFEVARNENRGDHDPAGEISENELKKGEIAAA